jgi:hypothetical protein
MCRASTSCFLIVKKDVDGRVKPGHDGKEIIGTVAGIVL